MRKSAMNPRPVLKLLLCGLLVTACCIGGSNSAAAFGLFGFGRGGGYGRPGMGAPSWRRTPPPRFGGGFAGRPPGGGGGPSRHAPIVGGGIVGGGASGGNDANNRDNNNNGRTAPPVAAGDQPLIPNEIITAFEPDATPQAIDQFARRFALSPSEQREVEHLGRGLSIKESAQQLEISPETVRVRRKRVYRKMRLSGHEALLALLLRESLTPMRLRDARER